MRQSLKRQALDKQHQVKHAHNRHKRISLWLTIPLFASLSLLALSYYNWQTTHYIARNTIEMTRAQADSRAFAKVSAAKKAESLARTAMEAAMASRAQSERDVAAEKQTTQPASTNCGVTDPSSTTVVINKKTLF